MHDSRSYRDNAAQCLLAAQEACQPYYRKLRLSMASSWLSLACQDEAMDNLLASLDTAEDRDRGSQCLKRAAGGVLNDLGQSAGRSVVAADRRHLRSEQVESNGLYVRFSKGPSVPGPFFVFKDEWRGQ